MPRNPLKQHAIANAKKILAKPVAELLCVHPENVLWFAIKSDDTLGDVFVALMDAPRQPEGIGQVMNGRMKIPWGLRAAAGLAAAMITLWPAAAWAQSTSLDAAPSIRETPSIHEPSFVPTLWSAAPFVLLLLAIACLPLVKRCHRFWDSNRNKLLVAIALSVPVLLYYYFSHPAMVVHEAGRALTLEPGAPVLQHVLSASLAEAFIPFIVLLFSLYTISGGIHLQGDLRGRPTTNTGLLAVGTVLASLVGTTGAAMLLIRPLLHANAHRRHVRHTVIFFIFLVCNIGGCLLPTGDPPLFLGYLAGVPFLWTLSLTPEWALCSGILLAIYYAWDVAAYRKESPPDLAESDVIRKPLRVRGWINAAYLVGVVLGVAVLVPDEPFILNPSWTIPPHVREAVLLGLAGLSLLTTPRGVRAAHHFTFGPIAEVAALFLGIFITMQAPIEILRACGPSLGLTEPWQFFWVTGGLSSFLDNAPTYAVFFETARSLPYGAGAGVVDLAGGDAIRADLLRAVSLGAVFMGANTYIGNGPNFMVRAIAQHRGIRMPSFFGYMLYSVGILIPVFLAMTFVLFVWKWLG